jgi:hypothetical protein
LRLARLKVSSRDVVDLLPKARAVMPYIESMPDDISVDIPNARVYHNIESRGIGFHNIFIELKKEINGIKMAYGTFTKDDSVTYVALFSVDEDTYVFESTNEDYLNSILKSLKPENHKR